MRAPSRKWANAEDALDTREAAIAAEAAALPLVLAGYANGEEETSEAACGGIQ